MSECWVCHFDYCKCCYFVCTTKTSPVILCSCWSNIDCCKHYYFMCITQKSTVTVFVTHRYTLQLLISYWLLATLLVFMTHSYPFALFITQMYPAAGDRILTAASTVTLCVSHNHSGYHISALMRCTVCLHNSNATGRERYIVLCKVFVILLWKENNPSCCIYS